VRRLAFTYAMPKQTDRDLVLMESITIPLSFLALVWVFGGALAAALPMTIGIFAILGSLAVLRLVTMLTDVSVFALNLAVAMGLALAVDYSLLMLSRYRDEITDGATPHQALVRTMTTAGRTVVFSALTVALSIARWSCSRYFLRSFAYAGRGGRPRRGAVSLRLPPSWCWARGWTRVRRLIRRARHRPTTLTPRPMRACSGIAHPLRHASAIAVSVTLIAVLMLLGAPFLSVRWGFVDDRVLPATASSRQVGDLLRDEFAVNPISNVTVVIPTMSAEATRDVGAYAAQLSRVSDVAGVSSPAGTSLKVRPDHQRRRPA
jgi:RND superfamily putative drug exporter